MRSARHSTVSPAIFWNTDPNHFSLVSIKNAFITHAATVFLQIVVVLIGIGVLAFMLLEPLHEGRNLHSTLMQVYFNDPFLAYVYIGSIPFFVALYKAFTVLGSIAHDTVFSRNSVRALRIIKYCAMSLVGLIAAPVAYLTIVRPEDDIAGGVAMGLGTMLISAVIAASAAVCERVVDTAVAKNS